MKQKPTTSQYSYMVTGLLTAKIQRNGVITQDDVKDAVETAKIAYDLIAEAIEEADDGESKPNIRLRGTPPPSPIQNYFEDYEWKNGVATWTELAHWLKKKGITSNRRISNIFRESVENGYIRRDENTRKYLPPLP